MQNLNFQKDIENIGKIPIVFNMLNSICQITGMGFAAIARVTEDKWITCYTKDLIDFGLKPGDELEIKTTICNEIRQHQNPIIIDNVSDDLDFKDHHTPAKYGFQSYISVPIIKKNGDFFGTLCAIDPNPNELKKPQIKNMFLLFAELISFHLEAIDKLESAETKIIEERKLHKISAENQKTFTDLLEKKVKERTKQLKENSDSLEKMNKELQAFAYISSHDLQEPLRKIQIFSSAIALKESENLTQTGKDYFKRIQISAERMQTLINDLLAYSRTSVASRKFEITDLNLILQDIQADLKEEIESKKAIIEVQEMCHARIIPFQMRQLLYNLFSNSVKFAHSDRVLKITISSKIIFNKAQEKHCQIEISDNGIGFEQIYSEKIFQIFQSLHSKDTYQGTGVGLSIVKKIVENHNGNIVATGKHNKGCSFKIEFPTA